jgi:hypothetical protein
MRWFLTSAFERYYRFAHELLQARFPETSSTMFLSSLVLLNIITLVSWLRGFLPHAIIGHMQHPVFHVGLALMIVALAYSLLIRGDRYIRLVQEFEHEQSRTRHIRSVVAVLYPLVTFSMLFY